MRSVIDGLALAQGPLLRLNVNNSSNQLTLSQLLFYT